METTIKMYEDFFNKVRVYYKGTKLEYNDKHIRMEFAEHDNMIENPDGVIIYGSKTTVYDFNVICNDNKLPYDISDMLIIILETFNKENYNMTLLTEKYNKISKKFDFEIEVDSSVVTHIDTEHHYGYIDCHIRMPMRYNEEMIYSIDINKDKEIYMPFDKDSDDLIVALMRVADIGSEIILHEEEVNDI